MPDQIQLWSQIINDNLPQGTMDESLQPVAKNLSLLTCESFHIDQWRTKVIPFAHLKTYADNPNSETVAIFMHMSNELPGWAVLMLSQKDAVCLSDILLGLPCGTTYDLDKLALSALAEVGNVTLSSWLNAISDFCQTSICPSPPTVVIDKLATILEIGAVSVDTIADELLLVETVFRTIAHKISLRLWMLPDRMVYRFAPEKIVL